MTSAPPEDGQCKLVGGVVVVVVVVSSPLSQTKAEPNFRGRLFHLRAWLRNGGAARMSITTGRHSLKNNDSVDPAPPKRKRGRPRKVIAPPAPPKKRKERLKVQPLLVSRADAAVMLGGVSVATMVRLEDAGLLHPKRLMGSPNGTVFYSFKNVTEVAEGAEDAQ
jgi:hypothetical protein